LKKKWKIIFGVALVLAIAGFAAAQLLSGEPVEVIKMEPRDIKKSFTEDGTVVSPRERVLHPLRSAEIVDLRVEEGDRVEQGQLVASLDNREMRYRLQELEAQYRRIEGEEEKLYQEPGRAEIESAEIAIERARESKEAVERDYQRVKELREEGFVPEAELEKTEDLLEEARYNLKQQEEALQVLKESYDPPEGSEEVIASQKDAITSQKNLVRHQMEHYRVYAPFTGTVIDLEAEEGSLASPEAPLVRIFDPENYEVETRVLTRDIYDIERGMQAGLTLEKRGRDLEFEGEVVEIAPYAEKTRSPLGLEEERVEVSIVPEIPEGVEVAPGYGLEVEFVTERREQQLVVPRRSLFTCNGEDALLVVEDGRARVRKVTTGLETREETAVTGGLSEGDLVIVDHDLEDLDEGSRVEAVER